MTARNPAAAALLAEIRHHPAFPELLNAARTEIAPAAVPRFRAAQAGEAEKARATWIYRSGENDQHEKWLAFLTGRAPSELTTQGE